MAAPVTSEAEACEIALGGLRSAVRRQMMSERPLGVFLSGGVDSSALVALAAECVTHPLKTFSVGFVGPDEQVLSEWPWARIVAERYGTEHEEFVLTEAMFRERLPHAFAAMDQPTSDAINSYWVSYAAAQHVTVALSGTGADELLLGYSRDTHLLRRYAEGRPLGRLPAGYVRRLAAVVGGVARDRVWQSVGGWLETVQAYALLDEEYLSPAGIGIYSPAQRDHVLSPALRAARGAGRPAGALPPRRCRGRSQTSGRLAAADGAAGVSLVGAVA